MFLSRRRATGLSTAGDTEVLGTLGNQPLELKVNGSRVLRLEPASGRPNVLGGFSGNTVTTGVVGATIAGGGTQYSLNRVGDSFGTIAGGAGNAVGDEAGTTDDRMYATVGGGISNYATGQQATIAGGSGNQASGLSAAIAGGSSNRASATSASVGGGNVNYANGQGSTISGGRQNLAEGAESTVSGGYSNRATGEQSTVAGGWGNIASGLLATVAGGSANTAAGAGSFAAGRRAKANNTGSFVWSDSSAEADFASTADNEFAVRATGGARFVSSDSGNGVRLAPGGGSFDNLSDRESKTNLERVDPQIVLQAVASLPVSRWSYKDQDSNIRHIGPMAQDFAAAFGVGEDDRHINTLDADGVALVAIQGLYQVVQERDARLEAQQRELAELRREVAALKGAATVQKASLPAQPWEGGLAGGLPVAGGLVLVGLAFRSRVRPDSGQRGH